MQTTTHKTAQTMPGGNTPTTAKAPEVRRVRTKRQVLADAKARGFEICNDHEVMHRSIGDMEPMPWAWGCAAGADLAVEMVQVMGLNAELGFSPSECLDASLRDALKHLGDKCLGGRCRASIAVGLLEALSEVLASSVLRGEALPIAQQFRATLVREAEAGDKEESENLKARAMGRRKAQQQAQPQAKQQATAQGVAA